jgi:hypothetical protein
MADNYSIEPLSDALFDELEPLMWDAFAHRGDRLYFDWKYRQNPAGPAIGNIARSQSGEIAAFYGMIPEVCVYRGEQHRVYQSCDTMTHSRHRRRGLFQRLAEQTYAEGLAADPGFFAYGFGGPPSTPGLVKMKWKIRAELPFLFLPFPLTLLRWGAGRLEPTKTLTAPLLEMMIRAQPDTGPAVYRDENFLKWRLSNPLHEYEFIVSDGAYAVFARINRFLFVMDFWEQDRRSGSPVAAALRGACADSKMNGLLTFASPHSEFADRLRGHFFLRNPFGRGPAAETVPFCTYGIDPFSAADRSWAVNPIDHDSY